MVLTCDHARRDMLREQCFANGSVISVPPVFHGELVGVLNLTERRLERLDVS